MNGTEGKKRPYFLEILDNNDIIRDKCNRSIIFSLLDCPLSSFLGSSLSTFLSCLSFSNSLSRGSCSSSISLSFGSSLLDSLALSSLLCWLGSWLSFSSSLSRGNCSCSSSIDFSFGSSVLDSLTLTSLLCWLGSLLGSLCLYSCYMKQVKTLSVNEKDMRQTTSPCKWLMGTQTFISIENTVHLQNSLLLWVDSSMDVSSGLAEVTFTVDPP